MWSFKSIVGLCLVAFCLVGPGAPAFSQTLTVETLLTGLAEPSSVALQPDSNTVFIAESGKQRVIRVVDGKVEVVVDGFGGTAGVGTADGDSTTPLAIGFLDATTLVVGTGGEGDLADRVLTFPVPEPGSAAIDANEDRLYGGSLEAEGEFPAEGDFGALVVGGGLVEDRVFVAGRGDAAQAWIGVIDRAGTELSNFRREFPSSVEGGKGWPGCLAQTGGGYVVVGRGGSADQPGDGLLCFFHKDGKRWAAYQTGLANIVALAYSPLRTRLFALDDGAGGGDQPAGLFKLVRLRGVTDRCESRRVEGLGLVRPRAMAFDPEGSLYLVQHGLAAEGSAKPPGSLLKISGLDAPAGENGEASGQD